MGGVWVPPKAFLRTRGEGLGPPKICGTSGGLGSPKNMFEGIREGSRSSIIFWGSSGGSLGHKNDFSEVLWGSKDVFLPGEWDPHLARHGLPKGATLGVWGASLRGYRLNF